MKETRVLHLSDLHFGLGFDQDKWEQINLFFARNPPDLVVITGDVVNHPFFFTLKRASAELRKFKAVIAENNRGREIPVLYIPGNHDTRIFGLFPVNFLYVLALFALAGAVWTYFNASLATFALSLLPLVLLLVSRSLFRTDLTVIFDGLLLKKARPYPDLNVGIFPLDSSKAKSFGAHGKVTSNMAADLIAIMQVPENKKLFWIAAVHHHPLPIPYDHKWEPAMLLKNAGSVLKNLIHQNVPLIVHGHKHHQHFSRFFLATRADGPQEISVLSAGTPTHSRTPSRLHSFNMITIDAEGRARVVVHESDQGAPFEETRHYFISSKEFYASRKFSEYQIQKGLMTNRLVSTVSIDEFGGAIWAEEFAGLKSRHPLPSFPYRFPFQCSSGHIFGASVFSRNGPTGNPVVVYLNKEEVETRTQFDPPLHDNHQDFQFRVEYRVQNFCALDAVQFRDMYAASSRYAANIEKIDFLVPDCLAVGEFVLHIKFPHSSTLAENFTLKKRLAGADEDDLIEVIDAELVPVHAASSVYVHISSPAPGAEYQIGWNVPEVQETISPQSVLCEDGLKRIDSQWLLQYAKDINEALDLVCLAAKDKFVKPSPVEPEYVTSASVFSFDSNAKFLHKKFGNGTDRMKGNGFHYGLGLAGQAFKARRLVFYDTSIKKKYRHILEPPHSVEYEEHFDIESEHHNSLAVPLYCDADIQTDSFGKVTFNGRPYGVLKISFEGLDRHGDLFDISNNQAQAVFAVAVSRIMFALVKRAILDATFGR